MKCVKTFLLYIFISSPSFQISKRFDNKYFQKPVFVKEIARFLEVFGINTASDISKFTKISRAAAAASFEISRRNRAVSCLYYKVKKFLTLRNRRNFYMIIFATWNLFVKFT